MTWSKLSQNAAFYWAVIFIVGNLLVTQDGEKNPMSRFATLRAMSEQGTFVINDYKDWTIDWSQAPNGNYYSNKAPGSILLAFPVFWILDKVSLLWERNNFDARGLREAPGYFHKTMLCFLLQILPFAFLTLYICELLSKAGIARSTQHFTALGLLFGQTAAIFMNSWFGHGFTAILFLASLVTFYEKKYFWTAFFWSTALLSEYTVAITLLPFALLLLWTNGKNLSWIASALLGAFIPGLLWSWYHIACFGSPFAIATQFYNPAFIDMKETAGNIYGVMTYYPNPQVIFELFFGASRGILVTQPWVLVAILAITVGLVQGKIQKSLAPLLIYIVTALFLILAMNAAVGSWNGGHTAGPRYISFIFPAFAFAVGLSAKYLSPIWSYLLWTGLAIALVFRAFVYATTILAPHTPLWPWLWEKTFHGESLTPLLRLVIFVALFVLAAWYARRADAKTI